MLFKSRAIRQLEQKARAYDKLGPAYDELGRDYDELKRDYDRLRAMLKEVVSQIERDDGLARSWVDRLKRELKIGDGGARQSIMADGGTISGIVPVILDPKAF